MHKAAEAATNKKNSVGDNDDEEEDVSVMAARKAAQAIPSHTIEVNFTEADPGVETNTKPFFLHHSFVFPGC